MSLFSDDTLFEPPRSTWSQTAFNLPPRCPPRVCARKIGVQANLLTLSVFVIPSRMILTINLARRWRWLGIGLVGLVAGGCRPVPKSRTPANVQPSGSPLGPSYVLLPLPSDDDSLLGRVLLSPPEPGRSLEETARPNPCADKLDPAKQSPMAADFEDVEDLSEEASARAMIGAYGFSGDVERASSFMYRLSVSKRTARPDTSEYVQCCKEQECGYGFISALVYGEGEYATGESSTAKGSASVWVASGGGSSTLHVIHRRKVRGWLAAVITVTDPKAGAPLGPLGVAKAAGISESTVPEQVKTIYDREKISVAADGSSYVFRDGGQREVTEAEFARRYGETTGSDEISDLDRRHNSGSLALWGSAVAVSGGLLAYGVTHLNNTHRCGDEYDVFECDDVPSTDPNAQRIPGTPDWVYANGDGDYYDPTDTYESGSAGGIVAAGVGGVGLAASLIFFVPVLLNPDSDAESHYLTERDARLYTERYNRALLRKTIRDVQHSQKVSTIRWQRSPSPSPGFWMALTPNLAAVGGSF
jgi:hypothetical protein